MHGTIESIFRVEWRPLAELAAFEPEWRALAGRALEPNVFYDPAFALAAAPVFGRDVGVGLVWSRTSPPRLLGLFPARIERRRYGIPLAVLVGWTHPYGPLGTPLVDGATNAAVITAWLDHVATNPQLPNRLLIPLMLTEGPIAQAFNSAIARQGGVSALFARHQRALLAPNGDRAAYIDNAVGRKKLKNLRAQLRQLGAIGAVTWDIASEPATLNAALGDFLNLEAAGWKGRAGTAASSKASTHAFMAAAVAYLARNGQVRIARLVLDGRAIAANIVLHSQDTAWGWKIAYDESVARLSPGVQILLHVTKALLDDPTIRHADSCATADHPMIDHIWRERLAVADQLVRIGPGGGAAFALARGLEGLRRGAIVAAKRLRNLIRR